LADDFSLRERGISETELDNGVKVASIAAVVDAMAEGQKTIWL
jgi:predicted peroxiredoxin